MQEIECAHVGCTIVILRHRVNYDPSDRSSDLVQCRAKLPIFRIVDDSEIGRKKAFCETDSNVGGVGVGCLAARAAIRRRLGTDNPS